MLRKLKTKLKLFFWLGFDGLTPRTPGVPLRDFFTSGRRFTLTLSDENFKNYLISKGCTCHSMEIYLPKPSDELTNVVISNNDQFIIFPDEYRIVSKSLAELKSILCDRLNRWAITASIEEIKPFDGNSLIVIPLITKN